MSLSERISPLIGRWVIAYFFLSEAWARMAAFDATASVLRAHAVPAAPVLLIVALAVMVLGGLSLVFGMQTRHGAMLLFAFTIVTSVLLHAYWTISVPDARAADYEIFIRNMAIAGALLLIVGVGPGPLALDNAGRKKR